MTVLTHLHASCGTFVTSLLDSGLAKRLAALKDAGCTAGSTSQPEHSRTPSVGLILLLLSLSKYGSGPKPWHLA